MAIPASPGGPAAEPPPLIAPQGAGGAPGWETAIIALLISLAVLVAVLVVWRIMHVHMQRERQRVLQGLAEYEELEAAELEASRDRVLRFQANSAAASPRRPLAVVVVQPDGTPTLCLKDGPAAECGAASAGASASGGATAAAERGPMHPVAIDLPGIGATVLLLLPNHRGVVLLGHGSGMWAQEPPLPAVRMESVELVRMQALQAHAAGADEAQQQQQPQPQPQPQPASDEEQESGAAAEQPIH